MSRPTTHVVTGATGMLGSAFVLDLLARTDDPVWCLVRAPTRQQAQARLHTQLVRTAQEQDRSPDLIRRDRLRAVPGDITDLSLVATALRFPPGRVLLWHSAASLAYEPGYSAQTHQANVVGTEQIVTLAQEHDAELVHISTAYVAGRRRGPQAETLPPSDQPVNNQYERTKVAAERLVAASGLTWRILRPSAVVADSRTLRTSAFSGLYDLATRVARFRRQYEKRHGDRLFGQPSRLCGDGRGEINLVPLDHVVEHGVRAGLHGASGTVYHLTNSTAPSAQEMYDVVFTRAGLPAPVFVDDPRELDALDRLLANALAFHLPYTCSPKTFDNTHTTGLTGASATAFAAPRPVIGELLDRHQPRPRPLTRVRSTLDVR
ncbi:SDR family oxidoreductase [Micromonospora sp. WMMD730]|uniref:SDR family oxidoreductase n=1 Tax=Micromonospora sp. WMMD730 TaxID=3404128 RepID=UPI003B93D100